MLYPVEKDHPLASDYTKGLSDEAFEQYVALAELVLDINDEPILTNTQSIARLQIALILQINFMSQFGLDPYIKASEGMSSQASSSVVWRDRYVDPRAALIVARVQPQNSNGWYGAGLSQSHRTNDRDVPSQAYAPNVERFR